MKKYFNLFILIFLLNSGYAFAESGWKYFSMANGDSIGEVNCLALAKDGSVWVGAYGPHLFRYKDNQWFNESKNIHSTITSIDVAPKGDVWISLYPDSLAKYDGVNWSYYHVDGALTIIDTAIDNNGVVWCATSNGVYRLEGNSIIHYNIHDGLKSLYVTYISLSPSEKPWVRYGDIYATDNVFCYGVSRFNGESWETFDTSNGLPSDEINSIEFGPDGYPYISYGEETGEVRGIMFFDGVTWKLISETYTGTLIFDKNGTLWILQLHRDDQIITYSYQIITYKDSVWNLFLNVKQPTEGGLFNKTISIDNNGNIWAGTRKGVLVYLLETSITQENINNPHDYILLNNYPNPFNSSTTISYSIVNPAYVSLNVYNIAGQKVATLVNSSMPAGKHIAIFDGSNLASGIYFYKFKSPGFAKTGKMMLMK